VAWVYLLRCVDGSPYVGATADLVDRVSDHQAGMGGAFTSRRRPAVLVYSEECVDVRAALVRERQIKKWTSAKKQALIRGDFDALRRLARRTSRTTRMPRIAEPHPGVS
jgi:putative endonuclease